MRETLLMKPVGSDAVSNKLGPLVNAFPAANSWFVDYWLVGQRHLKVLLPREGTPAQN